ncbi:MAG: radical SAM protein [Streptosporangiales bacterium]|nr:radical SAM protein [Streptosporangiales bacterium]
MPRTLPLITEQERRDLTPEALDVVDYRKSGLSLNHVIGCPLDCAYCVRHTFGLWPQRQPRALMTDQEAVERLVGSPWFQPQVTPIQVFNRATDPFLPQVRPHTFAVLHDLDARRLTNHVLLITRFRVTEADCVALNELQHLRVTLLITYSGIDDPRIEPFPSAVAAETLARTAAVRPRRYRVILYWRPLVPGLNDTAEHIRRAAAVGAQADGTAFTGLFFKDQIADYYQANGLPEPYVDTARRKILPCDLEQRIINGFTRHRGGVLFRKTSCAVSFAHGRPDYNGHYGIRELCDICPVSQLDLCAAGHRTPSAEEIEAVAARAPGGGDLRVAELTRRAARVEGNTAEQLRYYVQHTLAFQIHDAARPHHHGRHGRADIGWNQGDPLDD